MDATLDQFNVLTLEFDNVYRARLRADYLPWVLSFGYSVKRVFLAIGCWPRTQSHL
jgi:hypothetical protein